MTYFENSFFSTKCYFARLYIWYKPNWQGLEYKELAMVKYSQNATESKYLVTLNIWSIKNSPVEMMKQFIKKWM